MEEEKKKRNVETRNNMYFSLAIGIVFVIVFAGGLYPFLGSSPKEIGVYVPFSHSLYHGKVSVEKDLLQNVTDVVPILKLHPRNYTYQDVGQIAKALGMRYPAVFDRGNHYFVSTTNATLVVYKDGRSISYRSHIVPSKRMTMSNKKVIDIANKYISNLTLALPKGVQLVPHIAGGILANNSKNVYIAKEVVYNAYFQQFLMSFSVKILISSSGLLYKFNSTPVIINFNEYTKTASFALVYRELVAQGIPISINVSSVRGVAILNIIQGYALINNELYPAYFLKTRVFYGYDNYIDETIITYVK